MNKNKSRNQNILSNNKGITLIALVVTIIILLILAAVSINFLFGKNGLIDQSRWSAFVTELSNVSERIKLKLADKSIHSYIENDGQSEILFKDRYDESGVSSTLANEVNSLEGDINNLYYVNGVDGVENNIYLYEPTIKVVFKIQGIDIWDTTIHSIEYGNKVTPSGGNDDIDEGPQIADMEPEYTYGYYEPNLDGFDAKNTYVIYYSSDYTETKEVTVEKYIADGRNRTIEENGETYTFYDYKNTTSAENTSTWGNIKTIANGFEAWWVWIPRYAYNTSNISNTNGFEIKFTTVENKVIQIDEDNEITLRDLSEFTNYISHSAFTEYSSGSSEVAKELKGIWFSKYEPSYANNASQITNAVCYEPNMEGYDVYQTYIVTYNKPYTNSEDTYVGYAQEIKNQYRLVDVLKSNSVIENGVLKSGSVDLSKIPNDEVWYDYGRQVWGNIKTAANGLEAWWVWIPRYAYFNGENIIGFDVVFIDTDDKPFNSSVEDLSLYTIHSAFNIKEEDESITKLKGIWFSKYEPSYTSDVYVPESGGGSGSSTIVAEGATYNGEPYTFPNTTTDGHTHVPNGAGTKLVHVSNSGSWCDAYNGSSACSSDGHYRYCSLCGIRLRYYWCDAHINWSTKVIINDE